MDHELRELLEALRADQERLDARLDGLEARIGGLQDRMDAQMQILRIEMNSMEKRLIESIENRRVDEDIAFKEIAVLKRKSGIWNGGSKRWRRGTGRTRR